MWVLWVVVGIGALVVLGVVVDRLLLAAEARGWLFYRHRKPSKTAVGNAMMTVLEIYAPEQAHTVDQSRQQDADEAEDDDPLETP